MAFYDKIINYTKIEWSRIQNKDGEHLEEHKKVYSKIRLSINNSLIFIRLLKRSNFYQKFMKKAMLQRLDDVDEKRDTFYVNVCLIKYRLSISFRRSSPPPRNSRHNRMNIELRE